MKTITLDIETTLDAEAATRCRYQPDNEFAPWPLHQIECISMLTVERIDWDRMAFSIHSVSREHQSERGMLDEVEQYLSDADQVLTFNGRAFDIPALLGRAAVNEVVVPTITQLALRARVNLHLDLLDVVTANGAAPRIKLAQLCAPLGIPVKLEVGGDGVADLAAIADHDAIRRYCETDVCATWLAAQMWQSSRETHYGRDRWERLAEWIASDQPRLEHLLPYTHIPGRMGSPCHTPSDDSGILF